MVLSIFHGAMRYALLSNPLQIANNSKPRRRMIDEKLQYYFSKATDNRPRRGSQM